MDKLIFIGMSKPEANELFDSSEPYECVKAFGIHTEKEALFSPVIAILTGVWKYVF